MRKAGGEYNKKGKKLEQGEGEHMTAGEQAHALFTVPCSGLITCSPAYLFPCSVFRRRRKTGGAAGIQFAPSALIFQ